MEAVIPFGFWGTETSAGSAQTNERAPARISAVGFCSVRAGSGSSTAAVSASPRQVPAPEGARAYLHQAGQEREGRCPPGSCSTCGPSGRFRWSWTLAAGRRFWLWLAVGDFSLGPKFRTPPLIWFFRQTKSSLLGWPKDVVGGLTFTLAFLVGLQCPQSS